MKLIIVTADFSAVYRPGFLKHDSPVHDSPVGPSADHNHVTLTRSETAVKLFDNKREAEPAL